MFLFSILSFNGAFHDTPLRSWGKVHNTMTVLCVLTHTMEKKTQHLLCIKFSGQILIFKPEENENQHANLTTTKTVVIYNLKSITLCTPLPEEAEKYAFREKAQEHTHIEVSFCSQYLLKFKVVWCQCHSFFSLTSQYCILPQHRSEVSEQL